MTVLTAYFLSVAVALVVFGALLIAEIRDELRFYSKGLQKAGSTTWGGVFMAVFIAVLPIVNMIFLAGVLLMLLQDRLEQITHKRLIDHAWIRRLLK